MEIYPFHSHQQYDAPVPSHEPVADASPDAADESREPANEESDQSGGGSDPYLPPGVRYGTAELVDVEGAAKPDDLPLAPRTAAILSEGKETPAEVEDAPAQATPPEQSPLDDYIGPMFPGLKQMGDI